MATALTDAFLMQLAGQAQLYRLDTMADRRVSARNTARFFQAIQRDLPVTVTVEVGAHEAEFSRAMIEASPALKVFAYEANPRVYAHFSEEGALNAPGLHYEHRAIADTDGSAPLYLVDRIGDAPEPVDGKRQSLLRRVDSHDDYGVVSVPCARLDSLFGGKEFAGDVFSLWIDAEGAQARILAGAEELLCRTASIYIEVESVAKWAEQKLDRDILALLLQRDFVPVLRDFQFVHQYNMVLVRKDLLALVERRLHNHVYRAARGTTERCLEERGLAAVPARRTPASAGMQPELPVLLESEESMLDLMDALPLLRPLRGAFDPQSAAVVCHARDLERAVAYYEARYPRPPALYVADCDDATAAACPQAELRPFDALRPGMDLQLFFLPARAPMLTAFHDMARRLAAKGCARYHIEEESTRLFWRRGKAEWTPDDVRAIRENYNALADASSRYAYLAVCKARKESEPGYVPIASYPQYFHPAAAIGPGDVLCEGGVANGGTTERFYQAMQGRGAIFGFEPLPFSFEEAAERLRPCASVVTLVQKALWKTTGSVLLRSNPRARGGTAIIQKKPEYSPVSIDQEARDRVRIGGKNENIQTIPCDCTSIDDFFSETTPISAIKLDVEGAELSVMQGAVNTLRAYRPRLMLSIYHSRHDYISVLRMLRELDLGYRFYVGHHKAWFAETVLYGSAE